MCQRRAHAESALPGPMAGSRLHVLPHESPMQLRERIANLEKRGLKAKYSNLVHIAGPSEAGAAALVIFQSLLWFAI